jgi:hypothetical protein
VAVLQHEAAEYGQHYDNETNDDQHGARSRIPKQQL